MKKDELMMKAAPSSSNDGLIMMIYELVSKGMSSCWETNEALKTRLSGRKAERRLK